MKKIAIRKTRKQVRSILISAWLVLSSLLLLKNPLTIFADGDNLFGSIEPPAGVAIYQDNVGADEIGIILFLSNVIRLLTIAAGIWTMFNLIFAGWLYLTSAGDSSAGEKVSTKITNSIIGLVIIALAYTIAAIIGLLIFGSATFIINPEFQSVI